MGWVIDVSHSAAPPPGFRGDGEGEAVEVDRRRLVFEVEAHEGVELISKGRHERFEIDKAKFDAKMREKEGKKGGEKR